MDPLDSEDELEECQLAVTAYVRQQERYLGEQLSDLERWAGALGYVRPPEAGGRHTAPRLRQ
jgi:hypothetical protein